VNVRSEEWDENQAEGRRRRLVAGETLGATLYELSRGGGIAYHFHHGSEELLIVLRDRVRRDS
jgi:quercetin dioxygenase-like cupin family protein